MKKETSFVQMGLPDKEYGIFWDPIYVRVDT
jgi:hypothetical protein